MARTGQHFIIAVLLSVVALFICVHKTPAQIGAAGTLNKLKMQNYLRQIALHYNQYVATAGRTPQTPKEFLVYIKRSAPEIKTAIEKKQIVIVTKIRRLQSKSIVAYQREAGRAGRHMAVRGDRTIQNLTSVQLKNALKQ